MISFTNKILQNSAKAWQIALILKIDTLKISNVFYTYSSFDLEFNFKCYIFSQIFYFSKNVKTDTSRKFFFSTFVSSMPVDLNQYRGTVSVIDDRYIAFCEHFS